MFRRFPVFKRSGVYVPSNLSQGQIVQHFEKVLKSSELYLRLYRPQLAFKML